MTNPDGRALARPSASFTPGRLSAACLITALVVAIVVLPRQSGTVQAGDFQSRVLSVEAKRSGVEVTKTPLSDASGIIVEWQPVSR